MTSVSVVIPTYNRPELLTKAITSVAIQTLQPFEVLVVDDGRKYQADSIVDAFRDRLNITYIQTTGNTGGSASRNRGIEAARGDLVAFLDDDDMWTSDKLEKQVQVFQKHPEVGYVFGCARMHYSDHVVRTEVPHGVANYHERALTRFSGFLTPTLIIRRSVLDKTGYFDEHFPSHQEAELMIRVSSMALGMGINHIFVDVEAGGQHDQIGKHIDRKIAGRKMLLQKHADRFKNYPHLLAIHLRVLGFWQRDIGDTYGARESFLLSLRLKWRIRTFLHYLRTFI